MAEVEAAEVVASVVLAVAEVGVVVSEVEVEPEALAEPVAVVVPVVAPEALVEPVAVEVPVDLVGLAAEVVPVVLVGLAAEVVPEAWVELAAVEEVEEAAVGVGAVRLEPAASAHVRSTTSFR